MSLIEFRVKPLNKAATNSRKVHIQILKQAFISLVLFTCFSTSKHFTDPLGFLNLVSFLGISIISIRS